MADLYESEELDIYDLYDSEELTIDNLREEMANDIINDGERTIIFLNNIPRIDVNEEPYWHAIWMNEYDNEIKRHEELMGYSFEFLSEEIETEISNKLLYDLVNNVTHDGKTLLYIATENLRPNVVIALLDHEAEPNLIGINPNSGEEYVKPLELAYYMDQRDLNQTDRKRREIIIRELKEKGGDIEEDLTMDNLREEMANDIINNFGLRTIEFLNYNMYGYWKEIWRTEFNKILKKVLKNVKEKGKTPISLQEEGGKKIHVILLNDLINNFTHDGQTLLYISVQENLPDVVNALLENGADPNLSGEYIKPLEVAYYMDTKGWDKSDKERRKIIILALREAGAITENE